MSDNQRSGMNDASRAILTAIAHLFNSRPARLGYFRLRANAGNMGIDSALHIHRPENRTTNVSESPTKTRQRRLTPEERRKRLIEMTIVCLAKYGPQGAGIRQICRELKVSPGLVNYFFDGRNDLFVSAHRELAERFLTGLRAVVNDEYESPDARIHAIVDYYFADEHFDDVIIGASTALWALSRHEVDLKEAMSEYHHAQRELLADPIEAYASSRGTSCDAELLANCLTVFLTGLWFEMALNPGNISTDMAIEMASTWIEGSFPKAR